MSLKPLAQAIPFADPVCAFAAFAGEPVAALLDSADPADGRGRYAYIAADPYRVSSWRLGESPADPFDDLERTLARCRLESDPGLPPFQTGAVGFFGYELGGVLERLPPPRNSGPSLPDLFLGFYDTIAAFDLAEKRAWVIASDAGADDPERPAAAERMAVMAARIAAAPPLPPDPGGRAQWREETPRAGFETMVARAIDYIRAGDIYQANLSHRMLADLPPGLTPFDLHRRIRAHNPAPFSALLHCGQGQGQGGGQGPGGGPGQAIVSASPERFLRLFPDGRVETRPIKGTRPRGATPEADAAMMRDLAASAKDRAENLMIVDLLRNDLSKVTRPGSVRVPQLCGLESFASVHHLVSAVEAELRSGLGPADLLRATFPGGSITGAPKIRAMEIINELEGARRGPYCGSVAWIGFDGAMDSSIVIRTLVIDGPSVILQAGGGIVADSEPAAEYRETLDKARALKQCLEARGDKGDEGETP